MVVIAPSNPYVSIGPILAVAGDPRRAPRLAPCRCVAVSPLIGGRAVQGPLDRMLQRMAGGTTPAHVADLLQGPDRRARDRRAPTRPAEADVRARRRRETLMTDRDAAPPRSPRRARGGGVRIAAGRRHRQLRGRARATARRSRLRRRDRLARRRARRRGSRRGRRHRGDERRRRAAPPTSSCSRRRPTRRSRPRASCARRSARHPVLSVAAELAFTPAGVLPTPRGDLHRASGSRRARRARSSRGSTRSRRRTSAPTRRPTRTRSSAATMPTPRRSRSRSRSGSPRAARSTRARLRAPARSRA